VRRIQRLFFATWLGLSAACGAEETSPVDAGDDEVSNLDAGSNPEVEQEATTEPAITTLEWCFRSNEIWCDWMYRCFDEEDLARAEEGFHFAEQTCPAVLAADCQARTLRSVTEMRQSFDGVEGARCLEALSEAACGTWDELIAGTALNPAECRDVTHGLVEPGGECTNTLDCAEENAWCWTGGSQSGYCTDTLGGDAFQWECNPSNAEACAGRVCLELPPNAAEWEGLCTSNCRTARNCGPNADCFEDEQGGTFCLALCEGPDDCVDGLSCQPIGGRFACFVDPV